MTTITIDRAVVEQALDFIVATNKSSQFWLVPESNLNKTVTALRAALAQQDAPQGCATEEDCTKQPWCRIRGECQRKQDELQPMPPEQRQRREELAAMPQQAEPLNLADPAVRKRLATQWGYVPAAQVEPVGEILPNWSTEQERIVGTWAYLNDLGTNLPVGTKLYTAPPQRKPLTEEEIESCRQQGYAGLGAPFDFGKAARAIKSVEGEKK